MACRPSTGVAALAALDRLPTNARVCPDIVTRSLLAAGLGVDARVSQAMGTVHAFTWTTEGGGHYHTTPLALAALLWLVALDPLADDDRPLPIDWSAGCFERDWWDPDYRLFSHYDVH